MNFPAVAIGYYGTMSGQECLGLVNICNKSRYELTSWARFAWRSGIQEGEVTFFIHELACAARLALLVSIELHAAPWALDATPLRGCLTWRATLGLHQRW